MTRAPVLPSILLVAAVSAIGVGDAAGGTEVAPRPPAPAPAAGTPPAGQSTWFTRPIAAATVGGIYVTFATWAYFAWFHGKDHKDFWFSEEDKDWFAATTYAGGADKAGHLWASYTLSRLTTSVLVHGGWDPLPSSLVASGISIGFYTLSEIKDGYVYGFERVDELANVAGAALSVLLENVPAVDDLIDLRVEYVPSAEYRDNFSESGDLDFAQDYTGQSVMLALHLAAIPRLTDPAWLRWARYADLVTGFESRDYSPWPDDPARARERAQHLYVGVALNMQHLLEQLFCSSTGRRLGLGFFEVVSVPYTTLRAAQLTRSPP